MNLYLVKKGLMTDLERIMHTRTSSSTTSHVIAE